MPRKGQYKPSLTFDVIDSEEKAYILGFLTADGYIGPASIEISLSPDDIDILRKIKAALGRGTLVTKAPSRNQNGKTTRCRFWYGSTPMVQSLEQRGLRSPKPNPPFQNLDGSFLHHYVRGLFDGDGWILGTARNLKAGITGGSLIVHGVARAWGNVLQRAVRIRPNNTILSADVYDTTDVKQLLFWMYSDASIYLDRKYQMYENPPPPETKRTYRRQGATLTCAYCGSKFYVPWSQRNRRKYCSQECANKGLGRNPPHESIIVKCAHCKQPFRVFWSERRRRKYCSIECKYADWPDHRN